MLNNEMTMIKEKIDASDVNISLLKDELEEAKKENSKLRGILKTLEKVNQELYYD